MFIVAELYRRQFLHEMIFAQWLNDSNFLFLVLVFWWALSHFSRGGEAQTALGPSWDIKTLHWCRKWSRCEGKKSSRTFPQQKTSVFWTMVFWWVSACLSTIMVFFVTRCIFTDLIWGMEAHCWNLKCPQVFDKMWFEWQRSFIHAAQLWSRERSGRQQNTSAWIRHSFCFHFLILQPLSEKKKPSFILSAKSKDTRNIRKKR